MSSSSSSSNTGSQNHASEDAATYLRNTSFNRGEGSPSSVDAVTASDLLNAGSFDPARLHPMANIGDTLDYLLLEDDKRSQLPGAGTPLPSRGWSDDLCYGTGTTYLTAGVKPMLAAATIMTGMAGGWSWLKEVLL
ncbi:Mitochondrial import inner membrane translocase subunit tim23 [Tulasnella sp. 403]|nr:Mitochondrial import inner membrane translocase subunit tim23 [Tulasnella sp. 403]